MISLLLCAHFIFLSIDTEQSVLLSLSAISDLSIHPCACFLHCSFHWGYNALLFDCLLRGLFDLISSSLVHSSAMYSMYPLQFSCLVFQHCSTFSNPELWLQMIPYLLILILSLLNSQTTCFNSSSSVVCVCVCVCTCVGVGLAVVMLIRSWIILAPGLLLLWALVSCFIL